LVLVVELVELEQHLLHLVSLAMAVDMVEEITEHQAVVLPEEAVDAPTKVELLEQPVKEVMVVLLQA
jgi:hypothetical protein